MQYISIVTLMEHDVSKHSFTVLMVADFSELKLQLHMAISVASIWLGCSGFCADYYNVVSLGLCHGTISLSCRARRTPLSI